jgi:hypothetical protein
MTSLNEAQPHRGAEVPAGAEHYKLDIHHHEKAET